MTVHLDRTVTANFTEAISREWLETNGIGGWAGSTITNAHSRRYHGLLGPYLTALARVRGKTGRKQGLKLVQAVQDHLSEAGIGQISEIFDGDAPHTPRGCMAQAWSVAEILRAYIEDLQNQRR